MAERKKKNNCKGNDHNINGHYHVVTNMKGSLFYGCLFHILFSRIPLL